MNAWQIVLAIVVLGAAGAAGLGYFSYRQAMGEAEAAWQQLAQRRETPVAAYEPAMVTGLPEIAQRFFNHAIAPGTCHVATLTDERQT